MDRWPTRRRPLRRVGLGVLACALLAGRTAPAAPAAGFVETVIADSIDSPVSMAIAPDGRIFVCEQGGRLRVIRRGVLLERPFVTVPAIAEQEEGLLGVALDPGFAKNRWIYLCYTAGSPARHNRVVRFTASGDTARAGSEVAILELDDNRAHIHAGGALCFGRDGKLYVGTGDTDIGELAQSLRSTHGKVLRIDPDGGIPADNPFFAIAQGAYRAIWIRGLRNAFGLASDLKTGRMYVNDVGGSAYEEVNEGVAGANYGWPIYEGPGSHAAFRFPVHSYGRPQGCSITGGAFYRPTARRFPREWEGRYFYAEYCLGEIRWIDPAAPERSTVFATTLVPGPVDVRVGPDGSLYYLARGNTALTGGDHSSSGAVVRIAPAKSGP